MNKKRVIIIRNAKSYDFGGGERFPVFLANILTISGFKPLIISRSPKLLAFAHDNNIKTIRGRWWSWQNWSGKFALLFPVYLIWQIILTIWYLNIFIKEKPDIIHVQSKDDFIAATWAGKLLGKRVIWTDHADLKHIWKNIGIWYKNPIGKLIHHTAKYANEITVVSESELALVSDNLSPNSPIRHKLHVIYNGTTDVSSQYKKVTDNKTFTFCTVSRLVADKGVTEIISAFIKFSKDYSNSKLIIIGDGPEEDKFKEQAKDYSNIEFLGYQKNPLGHIRQSDIYLHATYHEGFSISLVEASMLNCPIIATSVGGNVEIIHNHKTGILIPPRDVSALYNAMEILFKDKELRDALAKNARKQYLDKFQFDKIVKDEFIPLYTGEKS